MTTLFFNIGVFGFFIFIIVSLIFVITQIKKDNSLMDIAYGPIFFLAGLLTLIKTCQENTLLPILILGATGLWASRLGLRIWLKNRGQGEDIRYANWRQEWIKKGSLYFYLRTYIQINLLQGFIILLISLPLIISLSFPNTVNQVFIVAGLLVFLLGFTIEVIADKQVDNFLKAKRAGKTEQKLLTDGLFRYSRRPNYFGETLVWWGMAIMVLPLPFGLLALISPLTITYIVTIVTGPMLEKIMLERYPTEYQSYMDRTNYFIPGPPKSN